MTLAILTKNLKFEELLIYSEDILMKPFALYSILKYLQRTVKKVCKNTPRYDFLSWGVYDLIFSVLMQ